MKAVQPQTSAFRCTDTEDIQQTLKIFASPHWHSQCNVFGTYPTNWQRAKDQSSSSSTSNGVTLTPKGLLLLPNPSNMIKVFSWGRTAGKNPSSAASDVLKCIINGLYLERAISTSYTAIIKAWFGDAVPHVASLNDDRVDPAVSLLWSSVLWNSVDYVKHRIKVVIIIWRARCSQM